jgi:protein-tyrosine phosphatase
MAQGRIDVHAHLIPGVDDGCPSIDESIACARILVSAGYSDCFLTPHVWPNLAAQNRDNLALWTSDVQSALTTAGIPLRVWPGSELNLQPGVTNTPAERIITYGLQDRYILVDMWADELPEWFEPTIRWLQGMSLTVILAHPERMRAIQDAPEIADDLAKMGVLLQGNLQCFADRHGSDTRRVAERYLKEDRYFMLGSDTHNVAGLQHRMIGLRYCIDQAGMETVDRLTKTNPRKLLPTG